MKKAIEKTSEVIVGFSFIAGALWSWHTLDVHSFISFIAGVVGVVLIADAFNFKVR